MNTEKEKVMIVISSFFGGGGGFNSGGSWKSNVDNYYAYTQTSGGGPSGGKGCGTIPSTILIVILVAIAVQNIVTALIVVGCISLIGLIVYLILKHQAIANQKKKEAVKQITTNAATTVDHNAVNFIIEKTDTSESILRTTDTKDSKKPAVELKPNALTRLSQEVKEYRIANPEWEGGSFFDFVAIAGSGFIENRKEADNSTSVGDKLKFKREPLNSHDSNAIAVYNESGIKLGYIPKKHNAKPARLMDDGRELFARLYSKRTYTHVLSMYIEIFIKD